MHIMSLIREESTKFFGGTRKKVGKDHPIFFASYKMQPISCFLDKDGGGSGWRVCARLPTIPNVDHRSCVLEVVAEKIYNPN